jgi:hypothetical protein
MDQYLVASIALVIFSGLVAFAYVHHEERKSRRLSLNIHSGPDDVETRARRVQ